MTEQGTVRPSEAVRELVVDQPHLRDHLMKMKQISGEFPLFIEEASDEFEVGGARVVAIKLAY